jgi:uncharacterized RDD family membrane protein YckC
MCTVPSESNPYAPPKAEVADHRNGDAQMQLAGRGARFGAAVLDTLGSALTVLPLFIGINFEALATAATANDSAGMFAAFSMLGLGIFAVVGLIWLGANVYLVATNAQTVGKRLIGIKVVCTDGTRAGFARIFWLRNVVNLLPSLIPIVGNFYGLIDSLCIFHESRRCIHDRIAGTIVVDA